MTLRAQRFRQAVKLVLVVITISLIMAAVWPRSHVLSESELTVEQDIPTIDTEHSTRRTPPKDKTANQGLLAIYKRILKDIASLRLSPSTAIKSCDKETSLDKPCVDSKCSKENLKPSAKTLERLLLGQYNIPEKYMRIINSMAHPVLDQTKISFVTALSANHYYEWQALLKSLVENVFPGLPDFRLHVYDLGLTELQLSEIKRHCVKCNIRAFPFKDLPSVFSNLRSYAWKPLLVKAHLSTSEFVFWMDSSVRFMKRNLTSVLARVRNRGMLISPNQVSTALHTDTRMYQYFGLQPCQMSKFKELEGTFLIFHNNIFTDNAIVLPWLACAFSPDCMYPYKRTASDLPRYSCRRLVRKYGLCHRFDQSALTAILAIIYGEKVGYVFLKKNSINVNRRGERVHYFLDSR